MAQRLATRLTPPLVLLLIYNAALLRLSRTSRYRRFGWMDNLNLLAWGKTVEEAVGAVQALIPSLEACKRLAYSPSLMLGIEIDSILSFCACCASCIAKALAALSGVQLPSRTKAVLRPGMVKMLIEAVVMPRLLYGAESWW
ncbi:hypothetical protein JCM8547_006027 [Rhodosporidiobolus lusitaniae]